MNEIFNNLVGRILNIPKEKILADYYESDGTTIKADALDKLVDLDAIRIKGIKESNKTELTRMHDDGYSKGKAESLSKFEKQLRDEYKIDADLKGIDLIKEIIGKNVKIDIDEEKIKQHPRYIELERKLTNEYLPKNEYEKLKVEFDQFKEQIEKSKITSVIKNDALLVFKSLKPVLSKDPVRAANQEADFLNKLNTYNYDIQLDGNHIIKTNDGKRLETTNGYPINFADFVKSEASKYYDFEMQDNKGNGGNDNNQNNYNTFLPTTDSEYITMLANETDPKKANALMTAWNARKK